jgi:uncharacterized protein (UPF0276 family)
MVAGATSGTVAPGPSIGIGYRHAIDDWIRSNLPRFDVLEITLDHCLAANGSARDAIFDLVGQIPLTGHGIGLSIGTDVPLDLAYLDAVAALLDRLGAPAYSEHLAFTRVPGRDLGNLLPLPRTHAVAESIIAKVKTVQSRISVPFLLENITYIFDWPDSELTDAEFLTLICRETGAGLLLDLENLYLNASNHGFDEKSISRAARRSARIFCPGRCWSTPIPTRCRRRRSHCSIERLSIRRPPQSCWSATTGSTP